LLIKKLSYFKYYFCYTTGPNPPQAKFVTHLKFVVREDADSLVVASSTDQGSQIDIWELREKPVTIHAMFQQKLNLPIDSKTVVSSTQV